MDLPKILEGHSYLVIIFISLLVAVIGWRLTIVINRIKDQKIAIIELINDIQKSTFTLQFGNYEILPNGGGSGGSNGHGNLTIFKMQKYNIELDNSNYDDSPVYFEKDSSIILDFRKHTLNPTLPKKIINILKKFHNSSFELFDENTYPMQFDYVSIESGKFNEMSPFFTKQNDTRFKLGNAIAYQSYLSFSTCCMELENSILKWSKKTWSGLTIENDFDI